MARVKKEGKHGWRFKAFLGTGDTELITNQCGHRAKTDDRADLSFHSGYSSNFNPRLFAG